MQGQLNLVWDKLLPAFQAKSLEANKVEQEKLKQVLANLSAREGPTKK
jgi:hypothetical protein